MKADLAHSRGRLCPGIDPLRLFDREGSAVRTFANTGSGNIGAANVARNAGALAGILTLLLDAAKGYLAVWVAARWTHGGRPLDDGSRAAAVIGHMFPGLAAL